MLVLSRKKDETIVMTLPSGDEITVTLVDGHRVKVGIDSPQSVRIRRGELPFEPARASAEAKGGA